MEQDLSIVACCHGINDVISFTVFTTMKSELVSVARARSHGTYYDSRLGVCVMARCVCHSKNHIAVFTTRIHR